MGSRKNPPQKLIPPNEKLVTHSGFAISSPETTLKKNRRNPKHHQGTCYLSIFRGPIFPSFAVGSRRCFSLMHNCGAPRRSPQCRTTASGGRVFFGIFRWVCLFVVYLFIFCVWGGEGNWIFGCFIRVGFQVLPLKHLKLGNLRN